MTLQELVRSVDAGWESLLLLTNGKRVQVFIHPRDAVPFVNVTAEVAALLHKPMDKDDLVLQGWSRKHYVGLVDEFSKAVGRTFRYHPTLMLVGQLAMLRSYHE